MRVVRSFVWALVLIAASAVLLTFTGPLLPSSVNLAQAEADRTMYAAIAFGVAVVAIVGLFVLVPLWRRELAGIRPARIGLATFGIALVAAAAGVTAVAAIVWGVVAPLPRRDPSGADAALAVTALWFGALSLGAGYMLWSAVRRVALRPVLSAPIGDGGLRAVTGIVRPHEGAVQLTDPVTLRPSVAWILDIEEEYWQEERSRTFDPFSNDDGKIVSTTTTSHKRKAGVAASTTIFLIDTPSAVCSATTPPYGSFPRRRWCGSRAIHRFRLFRRRSWKTSDDGGISPRSSAADRSRPATRSRGSASSWSPTTGSSSCARALPCRVASG